MENLPLGSLFLCPLAEFQMDVPGCFRIPDCPAYWARDPTGAEKLNAEEARILGFPDLSWRIEVMGGSWNSSVYHGIREFHEAKGFDVNGQDVAIELGYPLFHVSCTRDGLLARCECRYLCSVF
jgi:hypothetical protein